MLAQLAQLEQRLQQLVIRLQRSEAENKALRQQIVHLHEQLREQLPDNHTPLTANGATTSVAAMLADRPTSPTVSTVESQQLKQTIEVYRAQIEQCIQWLQQY